MSPSRHPDPTRPLPRTGTLRSGRGGRLTLELGHCESWSLAKGAQDPSLLRINLSHLGTEQCNIQRAGGPLGLEHTRHLLAKHLLEVAAGASQAQC